MASDMENLRALVCNGENDRLGIIVGIAASDLSARFQKSPSPHHQYLHWGLPQDIFIAQLVQF
jgi:hypothetical protein